MQTTEFAPPLGSDGDLCQMLRRKDWISKPKSQHRGREDCRRKKVDCFIILKFLKAWEHALLAYKLSNTQDIDTIKLKIQNTYLVRVGFLLVILFS